ncbi:MAG: hypothetical protein ACI9T7_000501 [Oleiphilaceae bacterium]|jgi:hypothetical protein
MKLSCTIIRKDDDLREPLGHWLEVAGGALECLNIDSEFPESESLKLLTKFSKGRVLLFVNEALVNSGWNPEKTRVKYHSIPAAYVDCTPRESAIPLFPIFIGCSLIASKPISKVYLLPL